MHPEIRKFWDELGYRIYGPSMIDSFKIYIGQAPVYKIETICHGDNYRYNGKWYSEEEMLKIVRLKVFI